MHLTLIINSIVCVLGVIGGLFFAGASVISIANMKVSWVAWLIVAAFLVPLMFLVSGVGAWFVYAHQFPRLTIGLIALPWAYGAAFVGAMLMSFDS